MRHAVGGIVRANEVVPIARHCFCRKCKARKILDRVGDKWSVYVIELLGNETMRFTEILRGIHGISQRMLTVTLRGFERDGLVTRRVHATVPPRVDYALTPMGLTLLETISTMKDWAHRHAAEIEAAQARYDRQQDGPTA